MELSDGTEVGSDEVVVDEGRSHKEEEEECWDAKEENDCIYIKYILFYCNYL